MTKLDRLILAFLAGAMLLSPRLMFAFQCPPVAYSVDSGELSGWASRFDVILIGTAGSVTNEETIDEKQTVTTTVTTLSVEEVLKGSNDIRDATFRQQHGAWGGAVFIVGAKYLVFARYGSEGRLGTYSCGVHQFPNEESDSLIDDTYSMSFISEYLEVLRAVL